MVIDQSLSRTHWDCARERLRHASFSDLFPVANPSPPWPWWRGRRRTWACVCGLQNDLIPQNGTSLLKLNCSQVEFGGRLCNQATHPRVLDNSRERSPFSVPHKAGANGLAEVVPINQCQRGPEIRSSSPDLSPSRRWRDADPSTWLVNQWDTLNLTDTGGRWLLPLDGLGNVRSATPRSKKEGRAGLGWWRKKMGSNLPPTHSQAFFFWWSVRNQVTSALQCADCGVSNAVYDDVVGGRKFAWQTLHFVDHACIIVWWVWSELHEEESCKRRRRRRPLCSS